MPESFEEAVAEVANLVEPVLRNDPDLVRWDPSAGEWEGENGHTSIVLQPYCNRADKGRYRPDKRSTRNRLKPHR